MNNKILFIGASGLLGTNLVPILQDLEYEVDCPTHKEFDLLNPYFPEFQKKKYDFIVLAAAYTDVIRAEKQDKILCWHINVGGVLRVLDAFPQTPIVYISSEYAIKPINWYSKTKQLAEGLVSYFNTHLIIRTLFKPSPFPWDKAFTDQFTEGDYVDVIASLIAKKIHTWADSGFPSETCHLGTGRKTMYELAKRTKPDVGECSVDDITKVKLPKDYL